MKRCHNIYDAEVGKVFIPECMGGAVYGPGGCTCPQPARKERSEPGVVEDDDAEDVLDGIERHLRRIEGLLEVLVKQQNAAPIEPETQDIAAA